MFHLLPDFDDAGAGDGLGKDEPGARIGFFDAFGFFGSRPLRFWPFAIPVSCPGVERVKSRYLREPLDTATAIPRPPIAIIGDAGVR